MSKILGIDLGTGFSAMAVMEAGSPKIITNSEGGRTTPSIVAWAKSGDRLVGQAAKRQAITNPKNTVYEIKRFIGRKYDEVLDDIKMVSYDVVKAPNGDCRVKIGDKEYSPEEISSFILAKLKKDAEAYLGEKVEKAVITVPAYFNDSQRAATKVAGQIAGLEVIRVVNEPTAAALSYGLDKQGDAVIAVADAGAGTYDTTILELGAGLFEVKATNGNTALGGKDYDQAVMNWLIAEFKAETGIDLSGDQMAMQRLKDESEKAKIALSTSETTEINLPFISSDATGPKHLIRTLTRAKFESLVDGLNEKLVQPCRNCMSDAGVKIDKVILVGGTTRIPSVQAKIKEAFGVEPSKGVNPDEVVAEGAAIQGAIITGDVKDVLLLDVTPLTLSICTNGEVATPMIERNTTIPTKKTQTFSNAAPMQPMATVLIGQGERKMFSDNKLLGQFNVELTPMPTPGSNKITITYDIDANGILTVTAFDEALNKKANITITSSSGLSKEEIEKAMAEAKAHEAEDAKKLELANEKSRAEALCTSIEKALTDAPADKVTDDEKNAVSDAVAKVRDAIKSNDIEKIKSEVSAMTKTYEPVVSKLYAGATGSDGAAPKLSKEQMMNDPKFKEAFGGGQFDPAKFANMFSGQSGNATPGATNPDGSVDAKFE